MRDTFKKSEIPPSLRKYFIEEKGAGGMGGGNTHPT